MTHYSRFYHFNLRVEFKDGSKRIFTVEHLGVNHEGAFSRARINALMKFGGTPVDHMTLNGRIITS